MKYRLACCNNLPKTPNGKGTHKKAKTALFQQILNNANKKSKTNRTMRINHLGWVSNKRSGWGYIAARFHACAALALGSAAVHKQLFGPPEGMYFHGLRTDILTYGQPEHSIPPASISFLQASSRVAAQSTILWSWWAFLPRKWREAGNIWYMRLIKAPPTPHPLQQSKPLCYHIPNKWDAPALKVSQHLHIEPPLPSIHIKAPFSWYYKITVVW